MVEHAEEHLGKLQRWRKHGRDTQSNVKTHGRTIKADARGQGRTFGAETRSNTVRNIRGQGETLKEIPGGTPRGKGGALGSE